MHTLTDNVVDRVIRTRQTTKVRADTPLDADPQRCIGEELCALAGWAPFHRPAAETHRQGDLDSIVPFRFYVLDAASCRCLRERLIDQDTGSIVKMLATADTLIQATWLPNPSDAPGLFDPTIENMEHIAAASAAVQNLLLAATARGVRNYWSSGGVLRSAEVYRWLGMPANQILLGSIFLFPGRADSVSTATSKLRDSRGVAHQWTRRVCLDDQDPSPVIEVVRRDGTT